MKTTAFKRICPDISWKRSGLVQADHRRLSRSQPYTNAHGRNLCSRLGTDRRIHLHPGNGAEMLSPARRRIAGHRVRRHGHDLARDRLPRGPQELRSHSAAYLHGGGHLLHEGLPAVHLHTASWCASNPRSSSPCFSAWRAPSSLPFWTP